MIDFFEKNVQREHLSYNNMHKDNLWEKRLTLWLLADKSLKRFQLIQRLSLSAIIFSTTSIVFTTKSLQTLPANIFITLLVMLFIATLILLWVTPITKLCLNHKNSLSKKFYEVDMNIELSENKIFIRNRCNAQLVFQMSRQ